MGKGRFDIAIVGGGAAGVVAAYRLWKELGDLARIVVYERQGHVGGRVWDIQFAGARIEVGGTVLHSSGRHVMDLMQLTGAQEGESGLSIDGVDETYAFWTREGFPVFCHTSLVSMAGNILKHVGPRSALTVTNEAVGMAKKWEGVYALQDAHKRFVQSDDLLRALDLYEPTRESLGSFLRHRKVNDRMAEDVVEAITHNMYNQGLEMNAFAGLVGLAGAGLAGGYLFSIDGGNWTLLDKTLAKIGAELRVNAKVDSVSSPRPAEGEPRVFEVVTADGARETYDAVIVAAPPVLGDYELSYDGEPLDVPAHPYQEVQATFVAGDIRSGCFKGKTGGRVPSTAFTATSSGAPFKSIGVTGFSPDHGKRIYKIFSAEHVMTEAELADIFTDIADATTFTWRGAYPKLAPGIAHVPFELAPGLTYGCAFETAAGSVEVEAVGGTNAALLAIDRLVTPAGRLPAIVVAPLLMMLPVAWQRCCFGWRAVPLSTGV